MKQLCILISLICLVGFCACRGPTPSSALSRGEILPFGLLELSAEELDLAGSDPAFASAKKTYFATSLDGNYFYAGTSTGLFARKKGEENFRRVAGLSEFYDFSGGGITPNNFASSDANVEIIFLAPIGNGVVAKGKNTTGAFALFYVNETTAHPGLKLESEENARPLVTQNAAEQSALMFYNGNQILSSNLENYAAFSANSGTKAKNSDGTEDFKNTAALNFFEVKDNVYALRSDIKKFIVFEKRKRSGFSFQSEENVNAADWNGAKSLDTNHLKITGHLGTPNENISLVFGNGDHGFICMEHTNPQTGGISVFDGQNFRNPHQGGFTVKGAFAYGPNTIFFGDFGFIFHNGASFSNIVNKDARYISGNSGYEEDRRAIGFNKIDAMTYFDGKFYLANDKKIVEVDRK